MDILQKIAEINITLVGLICSPFLIGYKEYRDYGFLIVFNTVMIGLYFLYIFYCREIKERTFKLSAITPIGRRKAILSRLIISIGASIIVAIVPVLVISLIKGFEGFMVELPLICVGVLFSINYLMITIFITITFFQGNLYYLGVLILSFIATIQFYLTNIKNSNSNMIRILLIHVILLGVLVYIYKKCLWKSLLKQDIL